MENLARKITLRNIGLDIATVKKAIEDLKEGDTVAAARVFGTANGTKAGQTDKGAYLKLFGDFGAVNLITSVRYRSGQAILPSFISDAFAPVIEQHGKVEFALEVGVTKRASAITGYEYVCRPLIESTSSERMNQLAAVALEGVGEPQALPAPAKKSKSRK